MEGYVNAGEQLVLVIYVQDIKKSSAFYKGLGFGVSRDEGNFMELRWEDSLLFMVEIDDFPQAPSRPVGNIRIMVPNVEDHWNMVCKQGLEVVKSIESHYYGLRDFIVRGPDGLDIRFASRLPQGADR